MPAPTSSVVHQCLQRHAEFVEQRCRGGERLCFESGFQVRRKALQVGSAHGAKGRLERMRYPLSSDVVARCDSRVNDLQFVFMVAVDQKPEAACSMG